MKLEMRKFFAEFTRVLVLLVFAVFIYPKAFSQTNASMLLEDEKNTIEMFKKVSPSVVFITNIVREADMFSFNVSEAPKGSGSGFMWDTKGHIVTNFHVVNGASAVNVSLASGSTNLTFSARVVGVDPYHDIAVLRIEAPLSKLKPVAVGASDNLLVGQKVLAIGNPFGFDQTLTRGIVSALGREIKSESDITIHDVIQTDASINPGNSGGPLLDSSGKLIGINTAIFSPSGASVGIGFAIPVNTVKRVVPQLIEKGRISRAGLGVRVVPDNVAKANGINGVIVLEVSRNTLASNAGLKGLSRGRRGEVILGDIIVGINGKPINNGDDLFGILDNRIPGDEVLLKVSRDGKKREVKITLQEVR